MFVRKKFSLSASCSVLSSPRALRKKLQLFPCELDQKQFSSNLEVPHMLKRFRDLSSEWARWLDASPSSGQGKGEWRHQRDGVSCTPDLSQSRTDTETGTAARHRRHHKGHRREETRLTDQGQCGPREAKGEREENEKQGRERKET